MDHGKIKGAAKLLIQKLGAYWSVKDLPALQDEPPEEEEEQKEVIDLLVNLPGPGPVGDALTYAMSHHKHDLEERILARPNLNVQKPMQVLLNRMILLRCTRPLMRGACHSSKCSSKDQRWMQLKKMM
jgi:hypothetical protein